MYAILRFSKLKSAGEISASSSHMMRNRPTANADPDRTKSNRILRGTENPVADVDARLINTTQRRKNSVLTLEVLMTVSPEWFENATKSQKSDWLKSSQKWLENEFGADNIAHLQLHLDETTPHLTGFIVPIDPSTGRLNAAKWTDGSAKLAKLQDGYTNSVEHLGIKRGLQGSEATHEEIKHFYGAIKAEIPNIETPIVAQPPIMLKSETRNEWADNESKSIINAQSESIETLKNQARAGIIADRKVRKYQANAEKYRNEADVARDIPLEEIAKLLNLKPHKDDKSKWVDDDGDFAISFNEKKFFDHINGKGGGGAIDLVIHVTGWEFKKAISWMGHGIGEVKTARAVTAHAAQSARKIVAQAMIDEPKFTPPKKSTDLKTRIQVSTYLTKKRGISIETLKGPSKNGKIYADEHGNAVFLGLEADGSVGGAELRGTGEKPFHGFSKGSSRDVCFEVSTESASTIKPTLIITESAIDALSYVELHQAESLVVVSTGGAKPSLPKSLENRIGDFEEVVIAFDNDKAGKKASEQLMYVLKSICSKIRSIVPSIGKDWNDVLIDSKVKTSTADDYSPISTGITLS